MRDTSALKRRPFIDLGDNRRQRLPSSTRPNRVDAFSPIRSHVRKESQIMIEIELPTVSTFCQLGAADARLEFFNFWFGTGATPVFSEGVADSRP